MILQSVLRIPPRHRSGRTSSSTCRMLPTRSFTAWTGLDRVGAWMYGSNDAESTRGAAEDAAEGASTIKVRPRPHDWSGIARGDRRLASSPFPCIGSECEATGRCHPAGVLCQPFKDVKRPESDPQQWQRMCCECSEDVTELERWRTIAVSAQQKAQQQQAEQAARNAALETTAAAAGGGSSSGVLPMFDLLDTDALDDAEIAALADDAEQQQREAEQQQATQQQATQQQAAQQQLPSSPFTLPRFFSHTEERALGRSLWREVGSRIPRLQQPARRLAGDAVGRQGHRSGGTRYFERDVPRAAIHQAGASGSARGRGAQARQRFGRQAAAATSMSRARRMEKVSTELYLLLHSPFVLFFLRAALRAFLAIFLIRPIRYRPD